MQNMRMHLGTFAHHTTALMHQQSSLPPKTLHDPGNKQPAQPIPTTTSIGFPSGFFHSTAKPSPG